MWEILLEKAPYEQMDAVEAGQAIVEGKKLEIPGWAPAEYASLLSDCWHDDPALRPSFNDIYLRIEVPRPSTTTTTCRDGMEVRRGGSQ